MNQTHSPSLTSSGPYQGQAAQEDGFISPKYILSALNRHKAFAGSVAAGTFLCALAAISTLKPYYEASAELMIGARGMISPSQLNSASAEQAVDLISLNTQIGVLKSQAIALMVTQSLHLEDSPEYQKAMQPSGLAKLEMRLGLRHPSPPLTAVQKQEVVANMLFDKVRIVNDGRSAIISIIARSAGPDLAPKIANAYLTSYLAFERQAKVEAARRASGLLEEQIAPLRQRAIQAEQNVSSYRAEHGLTLIGDDNTSPTHDGPVTLASTPNDMHLVQMNHALGEAEADLAEKESIYSRASAASASGNIDAISAITGSPLIQNLRLQQTQINARIATLSTTALDQNPELVAARSQSARIGAQIAQENQKLLQSLQYEAETARARVDALKQQTASLQNDVTTEAHADIHLRQLVSEANAAQTVYRDYLSRLSQISAETTIQQAEARIVTYAEIPLGPAGPPKKQYGVLAFLFASILGVGAVLLRDRNRRNVRTLDELEQRTHLFGLGVLPRFQGSLSQQFGSSDTLYGQMLNSIGNILTFGHEAVRTKVTVVTSAEAGEGKTTLAISLAASVGARGKRALVIDCDPNNPSVLHALGLPGGTDKVVRDVLPGVDVYVPGLIGTHGVLNFAALGDFIQTHRDSYEQIILDTPPVLSFPDAGILASFAEGVILAVKWHSTDAKAVIESQRILQTYNARCLGAVLTFVQLENLRSGEHGRLGTYARDRILAVSSR